MIEGEGSWMFCLCQTKYAFYCSFIIVCLFTM